MIHPASRGESFLTAKAGTPVSPRSVGIQSGLLRLSATIGKDEEKDMREGIESDTRGSQPRAKTPARSALRFRHQTAYQRSSISRKLATGL
jgi:hypothetical protein